MWAAIMEQFGRLRDREGGLNLPPEALTQVPATLEVQTSQKGCDNDLNRQCHLICVLLGWWTIRWVAASHVRDTMPSMAAVWSLHNLLNARQMRHAPKPLAFLKLGDGTRIPPPHGRRTRRNC